MWVHEHTRRIAVLWCAAVWLSACGGGGAQAPKDGGNVAGDAAARGDGAAARDAGPDGSADAAVSHDGGGSRVFQCQSGEGGVLELPAAHQARPVLDVDGVGTTLHVLYGAVGCRTGSRRGRGMRLVHVPSAGAIDAPIDVVNTDPLAGCFESVAPAVLAVDATASEAFFATSNARRFELYTQSLTPQAELEAPGRRLTFDEVSEREREYVAAVARLGAGPVLVWAAERGSDGARALFSMRPEGAAQPVELLGFTTEHHPRALALAALEGSGLGVLAWADTGTAERGVYVQTLSARGVADGPVQAVPAALGTGVSLDVAVREQGAAVVYTVGADASQIRLLLLDARGEITRGPLELTFGNQRALDAAIAPFSTGYVIAFRSTEGNGTGGPTVRLLFMDADGTSVGYRNVAPASESGGQVRVEVATDGRILLAWPDVLPDGPVVRIARVQCS